MRRTVRGETSGRVAGADLTAPLTRALVTQAEHATTMVEVQRLVAALRRLPGVRDAALESTPNLDVAALDTAISDTAISDAVLSNAALSDAAMDDAALDPPDIAVGPASWRLALRVRATNDGAFHDVRPAVHKIAAAARRCLVGHCRPIGVDHLMPADPLSRALLDGDRAVVVVIDPALVTDTSCKYAHQEVPSFNWAPAATVTCPPSVELEMEATAEADCRSKSPVEPKSETLNAPLTWIVPEFESLVQLLVAVNVPAAVC